MSEEGSKPPPANQNRTDPTPSPHWEIPTLLESLPDTDPAVIREMQNVQMGRIHYAAIGRVAAAWAIFESVVDFWLIEFADLTEEVGICFTSQMSGVRPRLDAFIALVRHRGAKSQWNKVFADFAKDAVALGEQRNRAVHDVWDLQDANLPRRREATARKVVRLLEVHVPTRELLDLETHILRAADRFAKMADEIFNEIHVAHLSPPAKGT